VRKIRGGVNYASKYGIYICIYIYIYIIGVQPLGRFGQRPELSQATGIAPVYCILGKFSGVGCHYFPPYIHIYIKLRILHRLKPNNTNKDVEQTSWMEAVAITFSVKHQKTRACNNRVKSRWTDSKNWKNFEFSI